MLCRLSVLLTCFLVCGAAQAAVINVPGDQPTIQAAVNIANPNDTIQVAAGTFDERITINRDMSGVTLVGNSDAFGGTVGGPGITTITGGILFDYASTITGLTFKNLYLRRNAAVYLAGPIIRAGSTSGLVDDFTIENCVLDGQLQNSVGGFYSVSGQFGGNVKINHIEIKDILLYYVWETSSGGVHMPTVTSYTFTNNWIHECNGTVVLRGNPLDWTDDVSVHNNKWENIGGNASQQGDQWAAIEINRADDVKFNNNSIIGVLEGNYGEGQAVQVSDIGTMDMSSNSFTDNFQGVFIYTSTITDLVIRSNNISGNTQYGIKNDTGTLVDARYNWWGAADGPGPVGPGSGDGVSADVSFAPWLAAPVSSIVATVELEDIITTPVTRDILFISAATSGAVLTETKSIIFTNRIGTTTVCFPPLCLSAKDEQHTLCSSVAVRDLGGGNYSANFTGNDKLLGGDADNNYVDDIWDFGIFMSQLNTRGHPYLRPILDADFTDSGVVNSSDFIVLYRHFLTQGDPPCGKTAGQLPAPVSSITVNQLAPLVGGLANARKADLNRDGRVNTTDARLYYYSLLVRR